MYFKFSVKEASKATTEIKKEAPASVKKEVSAGEGPVKAGKMAETPTPKDSKELKTEGDQPKQETVAA